VAGEVGAASTYQPGWWCGALSSLLGRTLDIRNLTCDVEKNVLRFELFTRRV
jgi:hypothetical protein